MSDVPDPAWVPRPGRAGAVGGVLLVGLYFAGWVGVLLVITLLTVLVVIGGTAVEAALGGGPALQALQDLAHGGGGTPAVPTWVFVVVLGFQLPLMLGLAPLVQVLVDATYFRPRGLPARPDGWRGVFALRRTAWPFYALALVTGLCVGLFPGWIATQLRDAYPSLSEGTLDQINHALQTGAPAWRALFALEVVAGAAIVEELVFRGFLWDAVRRFASVPVTMVATSVIFAAYHMDPVQSTAVLFTGLALGWIRWTSGSVWPGVVLHAANNGLGVGAALLLPGDDAEPVLAVALAGAALTLVLAAAAALVRARRGGTLATDLPPAG